MVEADAAGTQWLVLVHQFPGHPGSLRVKVWRRLQSLGAVAIKHSVYVLPKSDQAREDFAWLLEEIVAGGAEGAVLEARFLEGLDDGQLRRLFNQARDADYSALSEEVRGLLEDLPGEGVTEERELREARQRLARVKTRLGEIEAVDHFGADGRGVAQGLVGTLADRLAGGPASSTKGDEGMATVRIEDLKGMVWVTRRGVRVDRIASAWLVRRWIDPEAVFKFASDRSYRPREREVRFDMFEAEFTHMGDRCTFEVLVERAGLEDPALRRIGEIVHDIDLKESKFGHEETAGIASVLEGITVAEEDDDERLLRGGAVFDGLYSSFQKGAGRRGGVRRKS